jgi:hypothetical protein
MRAIGKGVRIDLLVFRYHLDGGVTDGLAGQEGTFTMCLFWYIENLSGRQGQGLAAAREGARLCQPAGPQPWSRSGLLQGAQIGTTRRRLPTYPHATSSTATRDARHGQGQVVGGARICVAVMALAAGVLAVVRCCAAGFAPAVGTVYGLAEWYFLL